MADTRSEAATTGPGPAAPAAGPGHDASDAAANDDTFLFSGYARLPQDVSHQAVYKRVGIVVEVDRSGRVVSASTTLITPTANEFLSRLLLEHNVVTGRDEIERAVRYRYRGHSQGALISALRKIYEAVDQSPLATR